MTDKQITIEHTSAVTELLSCQLDLVGVNVRLKNAVVTDVRLTWLKETQDSSMWIEHDLPGGEERLNNLHIVIEEMLKQIRYRTDRKNFLYQTGAVSKE